MAIVRYKQCELIKFVSVSVSEWHIGIGLVLSMNCVIFIGLKLGWFKVRMNMGEAKKNKRETITAVGYKRTSEFATYTQISGINSVLGL